MINSDQQTSSTGISIKNELERDNTYNRLRQLKERPEDFSEDERKRLVEEASTRSALDAKRRWFSKNDKLYRANEHPDLFTPLGELVGSFGMVRSDPADRSPAEHMAGDNLGGRKTGAIFFLANGDVVAIRKIKAGDSRLPEEIRRRQESARLAGFDPDLSGDLQYFELQSSKTKREERMPDGTARLLPASTLREMIVMPGYPLEFGVDPETNTTPRTQENVVSIYSLDESERGELNPGGGVTSRDTFNIDAVRRAAGEALTGGNPARTLGRAAVSGSRETT